MKFILRLFTEIDLGEDLNLDNFDLDRTKLDEIDVIPMMMRI